MERASLPALDLCEAVEDRAHVESHPERHFHHGLLVHRLELADRDRHAVRLDEGPRISDRHEALAAYGKSLVSVGYPWPLIEAHRMAVTVRQLKPVHQETVMKMALRMGLDVRTILDGLTQVEGRKRSAFHEYLDKVARDLR